MPERLSNFLSLGWALIRRWALIQGKDLGHLFNNPVSRVGAYSRVGVYSRVALIQIITVQNSEGLRPFTYINPIISVVLEHFTGSLCYQAFKK